MCLEVLFWNEIDMSVTMVTTFHDTKVNSYYTSTSVNILVIIVNSQIHADFLNFNSRIKKQIISCEYIVFLPLFSPRAFTPCTISCNVRRVNMKLKLSYRETGRVELLGCGSVGSGGEKKTVALKCLGMRLLCA
jgi:hypothetical protein